MSTLQNPESARFERYRLHQKELLMGCVEDAALMLRRTRGLNPDSHTTFQLALALFEKRCPAWSEYEPGPEPLASRPRRAASQA